MKDVVTSTATVKERVIITYRLSFSQPSTHIYIYIYVCVCVCVCVCLFVYLFVCVCMSVAWIRKETIRYEVQAVIQINTKKHRGKYE